MMAAIQIESKVLTTIQAHIMKFLWRGRPPKVAKTVLIMDIEKGGIRAPELLIMNRGCRISWLGRMLRQPDAICAQILQKRMRLSLNLVINADFDELWIKHRQIPMFYKEMLMWYKVLEVRAEAITPKAIRQQMP